MEKRTNLDVAITGMHSKKLKYGGQTTLVEERLSITSV